MTVSVLAAKARLITYQAQYATDFAALNFEWIETFFAVEEEDRRALGDPQGYAIDPGGEIFFVLADNLVVGTVAMVPKSREPLVFELAKMAVRPDKRGQGYSNLLMRACIDFARSKQASEIMLVTNDSLAPAMGLYASAGFERVLQYSDARYERGNVEMRLSL